MANSDFPVCADHCGVEDRKENVQCSQIGFLQIQFPVNCNSSMQESAWKGITEVAIV